MVYTSYIRATYKKFTLSICKGHILRGTFAIQGLHREVYPSHIRAKYKGLSLPYKGQYSAADIQMRVVKTNPFVRESGLRVAVPHLSKDKYYKST